MVKSLLATPTPKMREPGSVPVLLILLLVLPADVDPGRQQVMRLGNWVPAIHLETWIEFQAPGFGFAKLL